MGVTALRDLAEIQSTTLDEYGEQVVAVDAHHWLFRYMTVQVRYRDESYYTTSDGEEVANLLGMLRGLPTLLSAGVTPLFVFDGEPEDLKADEIAERRASKEAAQEKLEAAREAGDVTAARKYKAQAQSLTSTVHETSRELLELLGIPYAEADGAGEGYAARLAQRDNTSVDAVYTGDYDALLFGSPDTVRPTNGDKNPERIHLQETLTELDLTHDQLVDAAILIGTDYNAGVSGIGPKRAVKYLSNDRDAIEIADDWDAEALTPERIEAVRNIFHTPPDGDLPDTVQRTTPDFEAAETFLAGTWELPGSTVRDDLSRFPTY